MMSKPETETLGLRERLGLIRIIIDLIRQIGPDKILAIIELIRDLFEAQAAAKYTASSGETTTVQQRIEAQGFSFESFMKLLELVIDILKRFRP